MNNDPFQILIADDDPNFRKVLDYNLAQLGHMVTAAPDGDTAWRLLTERPFDLLLTDVRMPGIDGLELLRRARAAFPSLPVILVTAHGDVEMAVDALQQGAADFITKPFDRVRLREKVERALRLARLERENARLREQLDLVRADSDQRGGSSAAMRQLLELIRRVAARDTTLLILGESGTGKECVARALHAASPRRAGPFVAINCAAIPPTLLESELFGHEKGAFTGADRAREGRIQAADGGTLLLDEVGDMPLELQAKLLRVLQERLVEPVGSTRAVRVDVRVLAATHRDLEALIRDGEFREDLFWRLNVVPLSIPPLRDRLDDIPLLVRHFLRRFGEPEVDVDPAAIEMLKSHPWPGNVRELGNAVERALALRADPARLAAADFMLSTPAGPAPAAGGFELPEGGVVLDDLERHLIDAALRRTGGNQTRAAQLLGITRQKLIYRMQKHGID